jgi:undecaprenyl phosphate-alpha-L-ara4N flippase subunit ArnE
VRLFRGKPPPHKHTSPLDPDYEPPAPPGERRNKALIIALILLSVALAAVAQLTLKYGMNQVAQVGESRSAAGTLVGAARQPAVWGGLAIFGISSVFWMLVLSRASLSFAYPFAALTYVMILVFDWLVLKEPVVALRWAGVAFIIAGLVLVSRTGHA